MPQSRREVNLTREAISGLYALGRGDPTLAAIGLLLDEMKRGNLPEKAKPLADLPHGYEVDVDTVRIAYQDIPAGPLKILTIERREMDLE